MTTKYATRYTYTLGAPAMADRHGAQFNPAPVVKATADVVFYSWWHTDPYANLAHLPGFEVEIAEDYRLVAELVEQLALEVVGRSICRAHHANRLSVGGGRWARGGV